VKDPLAFRSVRQERPDLLRDDRRYRLDDSEMNVSVSEVTQLDEAIALGRSFVHLGLLERIGASPAIVEGCHVRALSYAQPNGRAGPFRPGSRELSQLGFQLGRSWKRLSRSIARPRLSAAERGAVVAISALYDRF
jgi:hypothetical protein